MGRTVRGLLVVGALAGSAVLVPGVDAGARSVEPIAYTCKDAGEVPVVPEFDADLSIDGTPTVASPKVFQPVTWTFAIDEPALAPPVKVTLQFLRLRIPLPDDLTNVSASVVAGTGETPNPPVSDISVQVSGEEIVVQLPATPDLAHRIQADTDGTLRYPYVVGAEDGPPLPLVVLPRIKVTATPTPVAGGTNIEWRAPVIESRAPVVGSPTPRDVTCSANADPDPVVVSTPVSATRQTCDGRPVTVQIGFNAPTTGNDVIQGTAANNTVSGRAGNDRFCGLAGNDTFNGGAGNDRAIGGAGNDKLRGDAGDDRLQGDAGSDNLQGGTGRDALIGGAQRDTCNGGPQRDTAPTCEIRQNIP
jgi:Ca2+-binding RTX toxin-like protein